MANVQRELEVMRELTTVFISYEPKSVVLTPYSRQETETGGWIHVTGEPRATQIMTLIEPGSEPTPVQQTVDGVQREAEMMLLAPYDAEMAVGDRFSVDGRDYEITQIWPENGYERRAWVIQYG